MTQAKAAGANGGWRSGTSDLCDNRSIHAPSRLLEAHHIPAELRATAAWVSWRYEQAVERRTKVPYRVDGQGKLVGKATSTNPAHGQAFEIALAAYEAGRCDGLGLILTGTPYAGVDLDRVVAEDGTIHPNARLIVDTLDSYTEVSPSGRGLRVIVRGAMPAGRHKREYPAWAPATDPPPAVEMYDTGRYLTLTGWWISGTPVDVDERADELAAVHRRYIDLPEEGASASGAPAYTWASDVDLLAAIRRSQQAATFDQLYTGDRSGYATPSDADYALTCILAWWTKDPAQIERVLWGSHLVRDKWRERPDYVLHYLVEPALRFVRAGYTGPSSQRQSKQRETASVTLPKVRTVTMADVEHERTSWAWRGYLPFGSLTTLDGDPGCGKTTLALDIAARLTQGRFMPDRSRSDLDGPATVLILSVEDHLAATLRPRLEAAGANLTRVHAIVGVPEDDDDVRPITLPTDWPSIREAAVRHGARMVLLDPLMALLGGETNSHRDQDVRRALVPGVRMAQELGLALVVIRHLTKAPGVPAMYRGGGSIGIIGAARSGLYEIS